MIDKTIIYRYLKARGVLVKDAHRMATELSEQLKKANPAKRTKPE